MDKNLVAKRPPLGWNSYDYYDTAVTEEQVKANADYMAQHLKASGWEYIVVDIEWYSPNAGSNREEWQYIPFDDVAIDQFGRLLPAENRFPSAKNGAGFKPLADYVHKLGLKFGIHIMRGLPRIAAHQHLPIKGSQMKANEIALPSPVCPWNPDMYGLIAHKDGAQAYYDSIFELYAKWGVDYVKVDDICNIKGEHPYGAKAEIELIHRAIENCGRPMVLSLSPGPALIEQAWHLSQHANMWRITDDFWDDWRLLLNMFDRCELWQKHVREGCWPDCDMLPLGKIGKVFGHERDTRFTKDEQITMMNLWCIFRSPLMLGAEMTLLDDWTQKLLTNKDLLRVQQYGTQPVQLKRDQHQIVWMNRDSETGDAYLALFNISEKPQVVSVALDEARVENPISIRDAWADQGKKISLPESGIISKMLAPHASLFYVIKNEL